MARRIKSGEEVRELLLQTRRYLHQSERFRSKIVLSTKNLREAVIDARKSRVLLAERRAQVRAICFPAGEFTLDDLLYVNPGIDPELVRFELADAIESRRIEFFYVKQTSFRKFKQIAYRAKQGTGRKDHRFSSGRKIPPPLVSARLRTL